MVHTKPRGIHSARRSQTLLLVIPLAILLFMYVVPNALNFVYAWTDWNSFRPEVQFVGFDNFTSLMNGGALGQALRVTLVYAVCVAIFQNVLALAFALGLERPTRAHRAMRVLIFIPVLLSPLAAGYIFKGILSYEGVLNEVLSFLGGTEVRVEWLGSPEWTIVWLAAIHAWKFFGLSALIYLAGLSAIPQEYTEAATLDGAGYWKTFLAVRWRLLAPAFTINLVLTVIGALSGIDVILATTQGGPGGSTQVLNMFVFQQFGFGAFGRSTAMTLLLFVVIVVIAIPLVAYLRRREIEQ